MQLLTCSTQTNPCPVADQVWVSSFQMLDPALLGITAQEILKTASWGFGFVLLGYLLGLSIGAVVGIVKQL